MSLAGWPQMFALTVSVEAGIALPLLALIETRLRTRMLLVVFANLLTHPLVYSMSAAAATRPWFIGAVFALELLASAVEAVVYARLLGRRAALPAIFTSFFANAGSFLASIVVACF